ncbi:cystathionine gamma-synthase [Vibrio zhanjiangensis]|uniref:Cytochrome c-type biogenesis protein n=1 Tax=Vibrio zhanjiangensis TaxID=1046128 RepID=A0ABQ6EXI0_9VIBR|nr:cytochrome c-type biogenesis protein [Vibrio zhanjiangensis]GLT17426.1 cystathionine gamma-synthase [Vibrio zhanjiangensis]
MKSALFVILFGIFLSFSTYSAIQIYEFEDLDQEQQFKELSSTLRCPKCQNNTIADSNAGLAVDIRQKVYEMTKQGKSKQEIVDYMVARYGNFVTYKPPFTPATAILWVGPMLVVMLGFGFIIARSRKRHSSTEESMVWDQEKETRLKTLLEEEHDGEKPQ